MDHDHHGERVGEAGRTQASRAGRVRAPIDAAARVVRAACGAVLLAATAGAAVPGPARALEAGRYFPLQPGNEVTYLVNGQTQVTSSVPNFTVPVNGVPTRPVALSGFVTEYYTNDGLGLRVHRRDFVNGEIAELIPPMTVTAAQFDVGQTFVTSGISRHFVPGYGTFDLSFTSSVQVETVEQVSVPLGTFAAVRMRVTGREVGVVAGTPVDVTATTTMWVVQDYGPARRVDVVPLFGTFDAQLVSVRIDTDGDGVDVTDDNCPAVYNPAPQTDTDGDGAGDACDADDDGDGLDDDREVELGTDPLDADSDDDGVGDGDEVSAGRNPRVNEGAVVGVIQSILLD